MRERSASRCAEIFLHFAKPQKNFKQMKASFLFVLTIFFYGSILAQDMKADIQSIQERYYRINGGGVKLVKLAYNGTDYFLEENKLSIAKKETAKGKYEYYFDINSKGKYPYFIYFVPAENSSPQIRAYYDNDGALFLLKVGTEETTYQESPFAINPYEYLKQDAFNAIRLYDNRTTLTKLPPNDTRVRDILDAVSRINESIVETDTSYYEMNEAQAYDGSFNYYNTDRQLVKTRLTNGADMTFSITSKYFANGKLIYATRERGNFLKGVGNYSASAVFYEQGKQFRTDQFSMETSPDAPPEAFPDSLEEYYLETPIFNVIPIIKYDN